MVEGKERARKQPEEHKYIQEQDENFCLGVQDERCGQFGIPGGNGKCVNLSG